MKGNWVQMSLFSDHNVVTNISAVMNGLWRKLLADARTEAIADEDTTGTCSGYHGLMWSELEAEMKRPPKEDQ